MIRALLALFVAALVLVAKPAIAQPRPYDAPRLDPAHARVPPAPPEYLSQDEGWIRFSYHPAARERVRNLAAEANAMRARLATELGTPVLASVEVRVAAVPGEMERLSPHPLSVNAVAPPSSPVVVFSDARLVVMSLAASGSFEPLDLERSLRHALAHLALDEATGFADVPRWFHEGFASHVAGAGLTSLAPALATATLERRLLGLASVEQGLSVEGAPPVLAIAEATDVLRFLTEEPRAASFVLALEKLRSKDAFAVAMGAAYGADLDRVEDAWRRDIARRYGFVPVLGATLSLWGVVAAVVGLRRLRRWRARRRAALAREERESLPRAPRRERPAVADVADGARERRSITVGGRTIFEADELAETIPPDPEVPKVEHDGNWYTLH